MKKIAFALTAFALTAAPAFAGSTTADIKVTGTVNSSCVLVKEQDATFEYTAAGGVANAQPGIATLYCNSGSIFNPGAWLLTGGGDLDLTSSTGSVLKASLALPPEGIYVNYQSGGQYDGADKMTYPYAPSAPLNQWGVPNGSYSATYTVVVTF